MKRSTAEWIEKAEADFDVVLILRRSRKARRYDPICYHCQQCAEKYLKARLNEAQLPFPRTHDLGLLLKRCAAIEPLWTGMDRQLKILTDFAAATRYPGEWADRAAATEAYYTCVEFRRLARAAFGLPRTTRDSRD